MADRPPFDPADLLGRLQDLVEGRKGGEGKSSWLSTLLVIAAVLAGLAAWSWWSWRSNRELAKLRHEKFEAEVRSKQAAVDAAVAKSHVDGANAIREFDKLKDEIRVIEADIRAEEARYEANRRAIDRIRSWNDIASSS